MRVLVLNCGSSSVKFAVIDTRTTSRDSKAIIEGIAEPLGSDQAKLRLKTAAGKAEETLAEPTHTAAIERIIAVIGEELGDGIAGVGHRVVHGAEQFVDSVVIDDRVLAAIESCNHLAPLHNPANVEGIRIARKLLGDLPQVAVFDTAFHQTMPPHAYRYAVPKAWYTEHGVRRYGFHGTSHRYVSRLACEQLRVPREQACLVTAHLGNGCSAAAVKGGKCVDTTMGLTPLEGLVMGTRSGDVDPSLPAFMAERLSIRSEAVTALLNRESGLLGLSGLSNDMRTLLEAEQSGNEDAALAIDVFCYRLAKTIGALAVPLGQLDALVFTGGIGENAPAIRHRTVDHLAVLGLSIDAERNAKHGRGYHGYISPEGERPAAIVTPTDEEAAIAADTARLIDPPA